MNKLKRNVFSSNIFSWFIQNQCNSTRDNNEFKKYYSHSMKMYFIEFFLEIECFEFVETKYAFASI